MNRLSIDADTDALCQARDLNHHWFFMVDASSVIRGAALRLDRARELAGPKGLTVVLGRYVGGNAAVVAS